MGFVTERHCFGWKQRFCMYIGKGDENGNFN